jgi:tumor protein p53-inducible protein 3
MHASADGQGVNIIIDFIGPDYWEKNIEAIAKDGRMVILASMSGAHTSFLIIIPRLHFL